MKKLIILASTLALVPIHAFSQSGEAIGSSGNIVQVQGIQLKWNMGSLINGIMTSNGVQLSNGYYVQQELEILSVEHPNMVSRITMYPNPAQNELRLTITTNVSVTITDLNGREIKTEQLTPSNNFINVSDLTTGTYIVSVSSENKTNNYKLVKQ
ncbi:T9SS type A sorting domain-containing protein [Flavobacterium hauense]